MKIVRICPKCSLEVSGDSKICRVCGSILDDVEITVTAEADPPKEETPSPAASEDGPADELDEAAEPAAPRQSWVCATCGEHCEGHFDACWNCGTTWEGTQDPQFTRVQDVAPPPPGATVYDHGQIDSPVPARIEQRDPTTECGRCGSRRIIPGIRMTHHPPDGWLQVAVEGDRDALIFRDRMFSDIRADICGECGHMELSIDNPHELYDHYLESQEPS